MRESRLTLHAQERLTQRTRLSPGQLKMLLDHGASVPVATQKGGRFAQRLVCSTVDENWFIVIQDAGAGAILTDTVFEGGTARPASDAPAKPLRDERRIGSGARRRRYCLPHSSRRQTRARRPGGLVGPGPGHNGLREKLIERNILSQAVACLHATPNNLSESVDFLLEHLPVLGNKSRHADE